MQEPTDLDETEVMEDDPELEEAESDQKDPDPTLDAPDAALPEIPFDTTKIKIQTTQDTLRNLIDRIRENEIDFAPDFQREAGLWDNRKMSLLIESILIRFPIPAFYFDASNDDRWLVIDGLQRLSAIKKFVIDDNLKLHGLEYKTELNGKKYSELDRPYQRRILECPIYLFLIQPGTPLQVTYNLFKRINTLGLPLNRQEIRHSLASKKTRAFLQALVDDPYCKILLGNKPKRMIHHEYALRFIAFMLINPERSIRNIGEYLDKANREIDTLPDLELKKLSQQFSRSLHYCSSIFGNVAFQKYWDTPGRRSQKNQTLFEVWTVCLARCTDEEAEKLVAQKERVLDGLQHLIKDHPDFEKAISGATQQLVNVQTRYREVIQLIQEVLNA